MRGQPPLIRSARGIVSRARAARPSYVCRQCRSIQISASPATDSGQVGGDAFGAPTGGARDSAGMRIHQWLYILERLDSDSYFRCPFRSSRRSLFPPVRHPVGISEALHPARDSSLGCGQGRKCRPFTRTNAPVLRTNSMANKNRQPRRNQPSPYYLPFGEPSSACRSSTSEFPPRRPLPP